MTDLTPPPNASACLMLADGTVFWGEGYGAETMSAGELCFNTAMTGYQEILTDPSYTGQIITFTFPHIGNVGCNSEDIESTTPRCAGLITRERPTAASNFRSETSLDEWLKKHGIPAICGIDTRALVKHLRRHGAQNGVIVSGQRTVDGGQIEAARTLLAKTPSMKGLDLAKQVSTIKEYEWTSPLWTLSTVHRPLSTSYHVVAIDYGIKHNILRHLAERGCKVTVVPADTRAEEILKLRPDGIFLSNGPGDPAATGKYAIAEIRKLIDSELPIFGICLGHQLLGIALGGKTEKMQQGHRGANHPVKNLITGNVEITSQNHGFAVSKDGLPEDVEITHISLFDGTIQGLRHKVRPIFCVQGHPEASPGPHDSGYLFDEFVGLVKNRIQDSGFRIQEKASAS
ncbi:MAG: glutamine-hydrolyzing carbamoyl-phosphate synthase small subunit [Alphaproteobacteria bacterium]|nr:glutamine-hydrolyzing carbamoyl-phosphate synthase small subunit [Alphaproteobacteria bacterium]